MMKALLLDGSTADDLTGARVRAALARELEARGWDVEPVILRDRRIGKCSGEFFCWVKHPGACMLDDDNRAIAAAIVGSDLMVYLTPVTFGGYSSVLKRMVDHQIQNISPFFASVEGETHHEKRYASYPDLLAIGWMDAPDERAERIFHHLVQRNAINFFSRTAVSGVISSGQSDGEMLASLHGWLSDLRNGRSSPRGAMTGRSETSGAPLTDAGGVRRALLLVGSPKMHNSTSHSLGAYLFEQLSAQNIETETIFLHAITRSPAKTEALLEAVDAADLVALAFPLYIDSLPAPAIAALERIAARSRSNPAAPDPDGGRRPLFAAIANCGFPELSQNATALAICETFARQAGCAWASSLALGGGGWIDGKPLTELGARTTPIRKALDLAAEALAQGRAIPREAQDNLARAVMPAWAYRFINLGWRLKARQYGAARSLRAQPYKEMRP